MKRIFTWLAVSIAAAGAASIAQAADTRPDWVRKPSGEEIQMFYPPLAGRLQVAGEARIVCTVGKQGELKTCRSLYASPEGFGFDTAAVAMSDMFRMSPSVEGGKATESEVRIPIRFMPPPLLSAPRPMVNAGALAEARKYVETLELRSKMVAGIARQADLIDSGSLSRGSAETVNRAAANAVRTTLRDDAGVLVDEAAYGYASVFTAAELRDLRKRLATEGGRFMAFDSDLARSLNSVSEELRRFQPSAAQAIFCAKHVCKDVEAEKAAQAWLEKPPPSIPVPPLRLPPVRGGPGKWSATPPYQAQLAAAPALAKQLGLTVEVELACRAGSYDDLQDCKVAREMPAGFGGGAAALTLAKYFRLNADSPERPAPGAAVQAPVVFFAAATPFEAVVPMTQPPSRSLDLARQIVDHLMPAEWPTDSATLSKLAGTAEAKPDPQILADGLAALREAYQTVRVSVNEKLVTRMVALMSENELQEAVAFGASKGGKAYLAKRDALHVAMRDAAARTSAALNATARPRLCAAISCEIKPYVEATAEPSTAKP
jgi:TonB family protein